MKQKFSIYATFIFVLFVFSSCIFSGPSLKGNGNVVEETRKTGEFDEIKVSRGMNVYISQGKKTKVVVKADENLLDAIEIRVEGNTLKVTSNKNIRKATSKKVFVTAPNISKIRSTAGSNVYSETVIRSKNLDLSSSAGSNMKLEVNCEKIDVSTSAGSNIKLDGRTVTFKGKASSGSNLKAEGLTSENCSVSVSSGANIWITATGNFNGHASSGGNIFYYGNPKSTDIEKSSGGNIIEK
jgi:uncharacterized protein YxeA